MEAQAQQGEGGSVHGPGAPLPQHAGGSVHGAGGEGRPGWSLEGSMHRSQSGWGSTKGGGSALEALRRARERRSHAEALNTLGQTPPPAASAAEVRARVLCMHAVCGVALGQAGVRVCVHSVSLGAWEPA